MDRQRRPGRCSMFVLAAPLAVNLLTATAHPALAAERPGVHGLRDHAEQGDHEGHEAHHPPGHGHPTSSPPPSTPPVASGVSALTAGGAAPSTRARAAAPPVIAIRTQPAPA